MDNVHNISIVRDADRTVSLKTPAAKRRKTDLTCIICEGQASGYNFNQISCHSCKEFFRRNASQSTEKLKCLNKNNDVRCEIRFDIKPKCQRCRLLKCFQLDMRKDFMFTPEKKLFRQQRIEENRRLRLNQNNEEAQKNDETSPVLSTFLTDADRSYLKEIENLYLSTSQSTPSVSSIFSFEPFPDPHSAFVHTMNMENFIAVRLINFLRSVPDFASLNEHDRFILVKYNLTSLLCVPSLLTFDSTDEACYFNNTSDESFTHYCDGLYQLCYGAEAFQVFDSLLNMLVTIVDNDRNIACLLMLTMIVLKGLSVDDDQASLLIDPTRVFNTQTKFTDLLFRYLLDKFSWHIAVIKITRIVEQLLKIQNISRDYDSFVKSKAAITHINPLMKSLLHLT